MKIFAFLLAIVCSSACAQTAYYNHNGQYSEPDAKVTPGAVNPNAIADTTGKQHMVDGIEYNICASDFRTAPIRKTIHNFPKLKKESCKEYGITTCDKTYEGDHLISIELGGCQDCLNNIWPQRMDQAKIKDHYVEDVLPKLVCEGKLSLPEAQQCIATDWVACGQKWANLK